MESRRMSTREALANSLKVLMMKHPFEKITIKMITDKAGFIRPTFYNYFYDKHEVLEWIFKTEVEDTVNIFMDKGDFYGGIEALFECMEKDREFYVKAFKVVGQNSFYSIVYKHLLGNYATLYDAVQDKNLIGEEGIKPFEKDILCQYYANGLVFMVKLWLEEMPTYSYKEWMTRYRIIIDEPIIDVMSGIFGLKKNNNLNNL